MDTFNIGDTGYIIDCGEVYEIEIVDKSKEDPNTYYYKCENEYYALDCLAQPIYKTWTEAEQERKKSEASITRLKRK